MYIIPKEVKDVLDKLIGKGEDAYVVGGCVRDTLLGLIPSDWDIATSARPEKIKEIFSGYKTIDVGIAYGTVVVLVSGTPYEITTFRGDTEYSDGRRPDSVIYADTLLEDVSRRDFTINAMALSHKGELIDYVGGYDDLLIHKELRTVGSAEKRFNEDALRMLRCLRFSSRLGLRISEDSDVAIRKCKNLLTSLSAERIQKELLGILMGEDSTYVLTNYWGVLSFIFPEMSYQYMYDQNNPYHMYTLHEHTIRVVEAARAYATFYNLDSFSTEVILLSAFLHDIAKPCTRTEDEAGVAHYNRHGSVGAVMATYILKRMRYSNKIVTTVGLLIKHHLDRISPDHKLLKRRLRVLGYDHLKLLIILRLSDRFGQRDVFEDDDVFNRALLALKELDVIVSEERCFSLPDLAVNGSDLINTGIRKGPDVGKGLDYLLTQVIDGVVRNNKKDLLAHLSTYVFSD